MQSKIKYWIIFAAIIATVMVMAGQAMAFDAELLSNPSFDTSVVLSWDGNDYLVNGSVLTRNGWTAGWDGANTGGAYVANETHYSQNFTTCKPRTGADAISFSSNGNGFNQASVEQTVNVLPGGSYTASVWVMNLTYGTPGFATTDPVTDLSGLSITEIDALGVESTPVEVIYNVADPNYTVSNYHQLTIPFTTAATTAKVKFKVRGVLYDRFDHARTRVDDASLYGPAVIGTIAGVATMDGAPIEGATVTVNGLTATTDATGAYSIGNVVILGGQVTVNMTYGALSINRYIVPAAGVTSNCNFSLHAQAANNLLANPGFEVGFSPEYWSWRATKEGWYYEFAGTPVSFVSTETHYRPSENPAPGGECDFYNGNNGIVFSTQGSEPEYTSPGGVGEVMGSQLIAVVPGTDYAASVWVKTYSYNHDPAWGFGYNFNDPLGLSDDVAYLRFTQFDSAGNEISGSLVETRVTTVTSGWQQLSLGTITVSPDTYFVRFKIGAYLDCCWTYGRVAMDDAVLAGTAAVANLTGTVTLDGNPVSGATVSIVGTTTTFTTGADGIYTLNSVPATGEVINLKAEYVDELTNAYTLSKTPLLINGTNTVDFAFDTPVANNLLANGGFEDPLDVNNPDPIYGFGAWSGYGWNGNPGPDAVGNSYVVFETHYAKDACGYSNPRTGNNAISFSADGYGPGATGYGHGHGVMYQVVPVMPNAEYSAYVYAKGYVYSPYGVQFGFGQSPNGTDLAGLQVFELDATGAVIAEHTEKVILTATNTVPPLKDNFQLLLSDDGVFTTQNATRSIKYQLRGVMDCNWRYGRVCMDDAVLTGPKATTTVTGIVAVEGIPVAGATVTLFDNAGAEVATATTDSAGVYTTAAFDTKAVEYKLVGSAANAVSENKFVNLVSGSNTVDFDLYAAPVNQLLVNGDNETGAPYVQWGIGTVQTPDAYPTLNGWSFLGVPGPSGGIYLRRESSAFQYNNGWEPDSVGPGPYHPFNGTQCSRHTCAESGPNTGTHVVFQTINVNPNTLYKASVMAKRVNLNEGDYVCLEIQELDANDNPVDNGHVEQKITTGATEWTRLFDDFQTTATTAKVKFMIKTNLSKYWNEGWACYDNAVLDGPDYVEPAIPVAKISDLKDIADNTVVAFTESQVVSAVFDGFYYIEDPERACGIKVMGTATLNALVKVKGTINTVDGERVIENGQIVGSTGTGSVAPLGMNGRTVLSMSAVGLYATTWGKVDSVGTGYFTMTDGSGTSVKVYTPSGFTPAETTYVSVTGALGVEMVGGVATPVVRGVSAQLQ